MSNQGRRATSSSALKHRPPSPTFKRPSHSSQAEKQTGSVSSEPSLSSDGTPGGNQNDWTASSLAPQRPSRDKNGRGRPAPGARNYRQSKEAGLPKEKNKNNKASRGKKVVCLKPSPERKRATGPTTAMAKKQPVVENLPALSQEEARHLRRAFDFIAGLAKRTRLNTRLDKTMDHSLKLQEYIRIGDTLDPEVASLSKPQAEVELKSLGTKITQARTEIAALNEDNRKRISRHDLDAALKRLGKTLPQKQLEYIIWEVDEDLDGYVDWNEFQKTFLRNMVDETGTEPRELFNIIQFLTLDENMKGQITEDETISTLFARYGAQRIEGIMASLFGDKLKNRGGQGTLTFLEYLERVGIRLQPCAKFGAALPYSTV